MGVFEKPKQIQPIPQFESRKGAFNYMLNYLISNGEEPMEAAKKADEFATIFCKNAGLPEKIEIPEKGLKKYMGWAKEVADFAQENPKAVEVITGVGTFVLGLFTGKKIEQNTEKEEQAQYEEIDFSQIKVDYADTREMDTDNNNDRLSDQGESPTSTVGDEQVIECTTA